MANDSSSKILYDIDFLPDEKFQKANKILETINESQIISIDDRGNLIFSNQDTEISASTFLFTLQQTSSKPTDVHFHILYHLNIPTQFTCNTYAKKFLRIAEEQKKKKLESESTDKKQNTAVKRAEETETASLDEEGFANTEEEIKPPSNWKKNFG